MTEESKVASMVFAMRVGRVMYLTLNRPHKFNNLRFDMLGQLELQINKANENPLVTVIVLRGNGRAFCAGFDFSGSLDHHPPGMGNEMSKWDPGVDMIHTTMSHKGYHTAYASIWKSPKPVIAQIHGWVVGGGSDMALCADYIISADDAIIGTPYSRAWGCYLSGMWIYRLGLTKVKSVCLSGEPLTGKEAFEAGLINKSVPFHRLEAEVDEFARKLASLPLTQLAAMKLIVNQTYDNMGLASTKTLGSILDGLMRHTPEGMQFVRTAHDQGVQAAVAKRDGEPWNDYSQAPASRKPRPEHATSYDAESGAFSRTTPPLPAKL